MQVGIHAAVLGEPITAAALAAARQAGVDCLECALWERAIDPGRPAEIARLRRDIEAAGLYVRSFHADFGAKHDLGGPYAETRQAGRAMVLLAARIAADLGCAYVVVHPGHATADDERPARLRAARDSLEQLLEASEHLGTRFALENMRGGYAGDCAAELEMLTAGLPAERIGFCLDVGHARLCAEGLAVARCMTGRMVNVHLHDNQGAEDEHLMPFDGTMDWGAVMRVLDEARYTGPYVFETAQPTPTAVMRRARETAQRLQELRRPAG